MKSDRRFGTVACPVSPVGLGCSRLGSVLGASRESAEHLLEVALDNGVTFFDTSDIYGQGESERLLGRVTAGRSDVVICSKVGKHPSLTQRAMLPFKPLIKAFAGRSAAMRQTVRQSRARPMSTNWDPSYITLAVERSLRRMGRDYIDILMLHSPSAEIVRRGDAVGALEAACRAGKIGMIGISVDDAEVAEAALNDSRVGAIQLPLHPGCCEYGGIVQLAHTKGVATVAREVLGDPNVIGKQVLNSEVVSARVAQVTKETDVTVVLIGTTNAVHLLEAISRV